MPSNSPVVVTSLRSGWKAYTFPEEKLTVNFPEGWTLTKKPNSGPTYDLNSPTNFQLTFAFTVDGLGGGCDEICQSDNLENVVLDTLNFYNTPLYVVVNGMKEGSTYTQPSIRFNVLPTKTCWSNVCYGFEGKNSEGTVLITGGYIAKKDLNTSVRGEYKPSNEFVSSADVITALSILETLYY